MLESTIPGWPDFYRASVELPLHPHFANIDPHLPDGGDAIELGFGAGRGVLHLLEKGFQVTAVDSESDAIDKLQALLPRDANVKLICSNFQDLRLEHYDVAIAQFSLFFLPSLDFSKFWPRLVDAIRPGGVFGGQLLGLNDDWAREGLTAQTREEVAALLEPFEILFLDEVERDGKTVVGMLKHWHVHHVVARKL